MTQNSDERMIGMATRRRSLQRSMSMFGGACILIMSALMVLQNVFALRTSIDEKNFSHLLQ